MSPSETLPQSPFGLRPNSSCGRKSRLISILFIQQAWRLGGLNRSWRHRQGRSGAMGGLGFVVRVDDLVVGLRRDRRAELRHDRILAFGLQAGGDRLLAVKIGPVL